MIRLVCLICRREQPTFDLGLECCGQAMVRQPLIPQLTTKEVIDTGTMARRVETFADVVQLRRRQDVDAPIK